MSDPFLQKLQERAASDQEAHRPARVERAPNPESGGFDARPRRRRARSDWRAGCRRRYGAIGGREPREHRESTPRKTATEQIFTASASTGSAVHKGISEDEARHQATDPLYFAALMVTAGDAAGYVAGAVNSTANVLRPGDPRLRHPGRRPAGLQFLSHELRRRARAIFVRRLCCFARSERERARRNRPARRGQHPSVPRRRAPGRAVVVFDERKRGPPRGCARSPRRRRR